MLHGTTRQNKNRHQRSQRQAGLEAKHWEQGYNAAQLGLAADNAGLYSAAHKAGFAAGQANARPIFVNVGGLPALARI